MSRQGKRRETQYNSNNINSNAIIKLYALENEVETIKETQNKEIVTIKKTLDKEISTIKKTLEKEITEIKEAQESNNSKVSSIEITILTLSNKLDNTSEIAKKLLNKLEKMEEEPKIFTRKIKEHLINALISVTVSIFVGFVIGMCVYYIKIR